MSTITIEKLVQGGRGLARQEGQVLLVRGVIPGETVSFLGGAKRKGVQEGTVQEVLKPSPDRVAAPCPVYEICGGCQLQHIQYDAQLRFKREILAETLTRVGKLQIDVPAIVASPNPYGYRSSVRFVVFRNKSGFTLGFHEEGSHAPVPAAGCLLVPEAMRKVIADVQGRLARYGKLPAQAESLEVRRSVAFGSTLLSWRTGPAMRSQAEKLFALFQDVPNVVGQVVTASGEGSGGRSQRWVLGQDWIADRLDDLLFRITDGTFVQANWSLTETLARTLAEWTTPSSGLRVLELYSGIGVLGLPLARRGALVTEVEANRWALADARHVAKTNHIGRCRFRHLQADECLDASESGEYDAVLMGPPRTGLSPESLRGLLALNVPRLFYVSYDPATLARDLGKLSAGGYRIARLQAFDMFPQTAHLETLVEMRNSGC
ncbi:MAG: 23S rRNA (uracil-5-)-methyltransferase RumA [Nitrospirae bacterium RIFCSPLOWO2_02_FULL_62_14]|nr:MAG: 23S rRNA (uracil-5-)-methyltransferase RumA [Nitrospirae bacterium RIFCSPLOWO2_02_FULL_62_14]